LLTLLVVAATMSGCSLFRTGQFSQTTEPTPQPSTAQAQQFTGSESTEPIVPAGIPESTQQTEQAREQVLAFINRVEAIQNNQSQSAATTAKQVPAQKIAGPGRVNPTHSSVNAQEGTPQTIRPNQAVSVSPPSRDADRDPGGRQPPGISADRSDPQDTTPSPPRIIDVSIRHPVDAVTTFSENADPGTSDGHVANRPLGDEHADGGPNPSDRVFHDFEQRAADAPGDVEARWRLGLLALATGRPQSARVGETAEMSERLALLLQHSMRAVEAISRAFENPTSDVEAAVDAIESLRSVLKERADIEIPSVALCSRVQAFGVYDELGDGAFMPKSVNQAIVYFEIENFTSHPDDDGRFRSLLADHFEVLNPEGEVLWTQDERSIEDLSRSRRADFFVAQRIALPATLDAGDYVLKITVEDRLASKRTQAIHSFHIGPQDVTASR